MPGLPHESSSPRGPRAAVVGPGGGPDRPKSARTSPPSSQGHGPCQSGRRWGTDRPVASTNSSLGRVGRGQTTRTTPPLERPGPGADGPYHGKVRDLVRNCYG